MLQQLTDQLRIIKKDDNVPFIYRDIMEKLIKKAEEGGKVQREYLKMYNGTITTNHHCLKVFISNYRVSYKRIDMVIKEMEALGILKNGKKTIELNNK
jgi:hypothetical protein